MDKGGRRPQARGSTCVAQVGKVVGRRPPLMCHCCRAPSATVDGPGQPPVTAARLAPASLHFFRHDGQLLVHPPPSLHPLALLMWAADCWQDVWRFGSEVVCISPSAGGETLVVATAGGHVWVLPVPHRRYFVLPTQSARSSCPTTHHHASTLRSGFVLQSKPYDAHRRR